MSRNQKIFISGGAGFIGYHLALKLTELKNNVLIYDNFVNYLPPLVSNYESKLHFRMSNLRDKTKIVRGNVCNKYHLNQVLTDFEPDVIIDLTAIPIVRLANEFFEDSVNNNLLSVCALLEAVRAIKDIKQFIYISSSYVYGDFVKDSVDEKDTCLPKDIYGGTKYCGEVLTESFSKMNGNDYTLIRPCAVYGPTDANMRVVAEFIRRALNNETVIMKGDIGNRIDFTYVGDLVSGIILSINNEKAFNQTFNLSYGKARSLKELADIISTFFPQVECKLQQEEIKGLRRGTLSIEKAKSVLGYVPEYSLEKGVENYIDFVKLHGGMI